MSQEDFPYAVTETGVASTRPQGINCPTGILPREFVSWNHLRNFVVLEGGASCPAMPKLKLRFDSHLTIDRAFNTATRF